MKRRIKTGKILLEVNTKEFYLPFLSLFHLLQNHHQGWHEEEEVKGCRFHRRSRNEKWDEILFDFKLLLLLLICFLFLSIVFSGLLPPSHPSFSLFVDLDRCLWILPLSLFTSLVSVLQKPLVLLHSSSCRLISVLFFELDVMSAFTSSS